MKNGGKPGVLPKNVNYFLGHAKYTRPAGVNGLLEDPLFGDGQASHVVKHERPWHRRAAELALSGLQNGEIATLVGKSAGQVYTVLRQPWARQRMIEQAKKPIEDEVKAFLESEVMPSLTYLKSVRDNDMLKTEHRMAAAMNLTDRQLGKPNQPMSSDAKVDVSKLTTKEIIERLARNGVLDPATDAEAKTPGQL